MPPPHVPIAFRRSARSPPLPQCPDYAKWLFRSPLPFGVHRAHLFASACYPPPACYGLHCLSAFTAFTTDDTNKSTRFQGSLSPLPFGVHRVHHTAVVAGKLVTIGAKSPLPFGV